jgi:hypothetical protein
MLEVGAPNACNLCHLDRSIRWTLAALDTGWGVRLRAPPPAGWRRTAAIWTRRSGRRGSRATSAP